MRKCHFLYFLLTPLLLLACKTEPPATSSAGARLTDLPEPVQLSATTTRQVFYQNLPSASGLEYAQGSFFVLGDDSPFLYRLNEKYELAQRYPIFDTTSIKSGRIPKDLKPDLESMALLTYGRNEMLIMLGSGSAKNREIGFLVNLTKKMEVKELDLARFYTFLRQVLRLEATEQLNLEGMAMDKAYTYLLQRTLSKGQNVLFRFEADAFEDFILGRGGIPAVAVYYFSLPQLGELHAGFSGAFALDGELFFTASVEETPNAIDDGTVHGSFLGRIDLRMLPHASDEANPLAVPVVQLTNEDASPYVGKAESVVVRKGEEGKYKVVVVSDDDKGHSELLELDLTIAQGQL